MCAHMMSAAAVLFWPLLALTLFLLILTVVTDRHYRTKLKDARRRLARVERRLSER